MKRKIAKNPILARKAKRRYWRKKLDSAYQYLLGRAAPSTADTVARSLLSLSMVEMVATEKYVVDYCERQRALALARLDARHAR